MPKGNGYLRTRRVGQLLSTANLDRSQKPRPSYKQLGLIVPVQTVLRRGILRGGLRREGRRDIGVQRNY